jgi:glyoxylase-like metal-dependent hydrolase (beta-lactamase superfamily II)
MSDKEAVTVVNVGYRSTNYWVISAGRSRLLFDIGWPGMMGEMRVNMARMDIPIQELSYCLASHFHIDHAGLAQEFKEAGVPLLVMDVQVEGIPTMKQWTKPQDNYREITMDGNVTISIGESRAFLAKIGIEGEILHTPGHADDSVSLLLDNGAAFTGDLTHEMMVGNEDPAVVAASWQLLRDRKAKRVYPGHGPVREMNYGQY